MFATFPVGAIAKPFARSVVLLASLVSSSQIFAQDPEPPPPKRSVADIVRSMPKSQSSSDGFVQVVAAEVPGDKMGFCGPLVQFASRIANSLGKTLSLPALPQSREPRLLIYAQDGRTNDTRVVARASRRRSGPFTRIWLPSPGYSDIDQLRLEVAKAYFRAAVEMYRELPPPKDAPLPVEMPEWLVVGALRLTDIELARADMRDVIEGWSDGYFPFFPSLCAQKDVPSILAGYLAGWMKEKLLFPDVLKDLAAGKELDGLWLAERLTGEKDAAAQDRVSDYRLLRLLRKVISPGRAAQTDLRIFASRLLLYPSFYDKMFGGISHGCTFREAVESFSEDPEVRMVASRKAREVPLHAIGKGEELQQASLAYMEFLQALARGEKVARLLELLDAADMKFGLAEEAVRKREEGK